MSAAVIRSNMLSAEFDRLNVTHTTTFGPAFFVINFDHAHVNPVFWPTTTALRWTEHHGWSLINTAAGTLLHRLPVALDAELRTVAKVAAELLSCGYDDLPADDWDDEELEDALLAGAA